MQKLSSSLDSLKDNLLRAVDAEYNVIKPENVLEIISQLETIQVTKEQLQSTRLGREINTIRQKINIQKTMSETAMFLLIEIMQRAKKLLRSWKSLLNDLPIDSKVLARNSDTRPRLILKVKLKRKRDADTSQINTKRRKIDQIQRQRISSELKTTQELLFDMQRKTSIVNKNPQNAHSTSQSCTTANLGNSTSESIQTLCASYHTVADLITAHRQRIFTTHDTREIEARPDLLLPPIDQLAFVYKREQIEQIQSTSKSMQSSLTTVEKLDSSSHLIALPFIDCPMEFDLHLDELVIPYPS